MAEKRTIGRLAVILVMAIVFLMAFSAALSNTDAAYAKDELNSLRDPSVGSLREYAMKPGDTYDCSDADLNTSVYISEPGEYTLMGKSANTRIMVESVGVKVFLEDGLKLNCGETANNGSEAAAINIELDGGESSGVVEIVSKKNAQVYLAGYMAPAVRKDAVKTELRFETEDPDEPGMIEAHGGGFCAGIGGAGCAAPAKVSTGNIVFNSGSVLAFGGTDGAGIGGGNNGGVAGITINGGSIKAFGAGEGAGIGGGKCGKADDIKISGGAVYAQNGNGITQNGNGMTQNGNSTEQNEAAAIGSGGGFSVVDITASRILISGGDVKAVSFGGSAIGAGGQFTDADSMQISGGTIYAESKGDGAGIGGGRFGSVTSMSISGGKIYAKGGKGAPGIGANGFNPSYTSQRFWLAIAGGTVVAERGSDEEGGTGYDIGGSDEAGGTGYDIGISDKAENKNVKCNISGGSVYAGRIRNAYDKEGKELHRLELTFEEMTEDDVRLTELGSSLKTWVFGKEDIYTMNSGKIYLWLPDTDAQYISKAALGDKKYTASIPWSSEEGMMELSEGKEKVILVPAKIRASKKKVKHKKKTTVKVVSGSGSRITVKARNSRARKALRKKYITVRSGKTAKITFKKKAAKGKYTFTVTSAARGRFKRTVKVITVKVK